MREDLGLIHAASYKSVSHGLVSHNSVAECNSVYYKRYCKHRVSLHGIAQAQRKCRTSLDRLAITDFFATS